MTGQMSIYDMLYPNRINPLREVALHESPYWKDSRGKIIAFVNSRPDIKALASLIKDEYSPYGFAGHYGGDDSPNSMLGWTLKTDHIETIYYDQDGKRTERVYSWEDFAREVSDMVWSGDYKEDV